MERVVGDLPDGLTIEELSEEEALQGEECELHGLKAKPELNGLRGRSLAWDANTRRMGVVLPDGSRLSVKLSNLRFGDQMGAGEVAPAQPASSLASEEQPSLYLSVAGSENDALRPALLQRGLSQQVSLGMGEARGMESATINQVIECMTDASPRVVTQSLALLAKVAPAQRNSALLSSAPSAVLAALAAHPKEEAVQAAGLRLLVALAAHDREGVLAAGDASDGCVPCVRAAIVAVSGHVGCVEVAQSACELLVALMGEEDAPVASPAMPFSKTPVGDHRVWSSVRACGGVGRLSQLVVASMMAHANSTKLVGVGCKLLATTAASTPAALQAVCEAGGARAAVRALDELRDDPEVRAYAMFMLANLASGDDECKRAVGEAGGAAAFAAVIEAYKADAGVLRLAIGGLVHLAQKEAGRVHVIGCPAACEAVVAGMRAHGSEPSVLDEACRFIAALAYGGPAGRRAALDGKADEALQRAIGRFGGAKQYAEPVAMARTILAQLEKGRAEIV